MCYTFFADLTSSEAWGWIIVVSIVIVVLTGFFLFVKLTIWQKLIHPLWRGIRWEYNSSKWKRTAFVVTLIFYVCFIFHAQLRETTSLNFFTIWLILATIAVVTINFKEIRKGIMLAF